MTEETKNSEEIKDAPEAVVSEESTDKVAVETAPDSKEQEAAKPEEKPQSKNREDRGRPQRGRRDRKKEPKEFEESIIQVDRVTRVTKGGRQLRFRVSVVIGDQKGRVGFGTGKSSEVMTGVQKAISKAKKNLINVPFFDETIPHEVNYKFKSTKIILLPAPKGKGVIAGGAVRKVLELAGVKNILSKMHGSRNRLNSSYATIEALRSLYRSEPHRKKEDPKEDTKKESAEEEVSNESPKKVTKETAKKPSKKAPKKTAKEKK